ncbi:unnamed protein product, partial [Polarella glacialis]
DIAVPSVPDEPQEKPAVDEQQPEADAANAVPAVPDEPQEKPAVIEQQLEADAAPPASDPGAVEPPTGPPTSAALPKVPPASGQSAELGGPLTSTALPKAELEPPATASDVAKPSGPGAVELPTGPKAEPEQGKPPVSVTLSIVSAKGLRNADTWIQGKSDPYVMCTVRGKPGTKFKTKTVDDCLDPVWNESFDLTDFAVGDILDFAVWDEDLLTPDDALGTASLTSDEVFKAGGFEGEVPLQDAGKGIDARLLLRIQAPDADIAVPPVPDEPQEKPVVVEQQLEADADKAVSAVPDEPAEKPAVDEQQLEADADIAVPPVPDEPQEKPVVVEKQLEADADG